MIGPYQPERSKDGKTADVGHAKLEEGEGDNDEIKDVPTLLSMKFSLIPTILSMKFDDI